ncbi:MAG: deoxyribonuclease V [Calditrichaeota bacterium]|nr:deoxyribonuclease V [Calditrichota bacterium]
MKIHALHPWNVDYHAAVAIQNDLRKKIIFTNCVKKLEFVAGADVSFNRKEPTLFGVVTVLRLPDFEEVERGEAILTTTFPYIPGLLTFREAPVLLEAFKKIRIRPDVILFDGQGIAHPRRMGLAAHMGLLLDTPSIGCAKSRFIGEYEPVSNVKGARSELKDEDETIGVALRTRESVKPIFVSVGHKVDLNTAVDITLKLVTRYRLPEPTRRAHALVNRLRESYLGEGRKS